MTRSHRRIVAVLTSVLLLIGAGIGHAEGRVLTWERPFTAQQAFDPSTLTSDEIVMLVSALAIVFGLPFTTLIRWIAFWRKPRIPGVSDVLTEPPTDVSPAAAAELLERTERRTSQLVVATLMYLGARGVVRIERSPDDFIFILQQRDAPLSKFERSVVEAIFNDGQARRRLSELRGRRRSVGALGKILDEELVERGWVKRGARRTKRRWQFATHRLALRLVVIGVLYGIYSLVSSGWEELRMLGERAAEWLIAQANTIDAMLGNNFTLALVVSFVVASLIDGFLRSTLGVWMSLTTRQGAIVRAKTKAFHTFLVRAHRYKHLGHKPHMLGEYLPYAVALGVHREWLMAWSRRDLALAGTDLHLPWIFVSPYPSYSASGESGGGDFALPDVSGTLEGFSQSIGDALDTLSSDVSGFLNDAASAFSSDGGWGGDGDAGDGGDGGGDGGE